MPIYEYRCQKCGHELERIQKMSDEPLKDCPACHKPELHRLVSAAGFRLKGGGWYETDFKQGNKRNIADSGNQAPKSSSKTGESAAKSGTSKPDSSQSGGKDSSAAKTKTASSGSSKTA